MPIETFSGTVIAQLNLVDDIFGIKWIALSNSHSAVRWVLKQGPEHLSLQAAQVQRPIFLHAPLVHAAMFSWLPDFTKRWTAYKEQKDVENYVEEGWTTKVNLETGEASVVDPNRFKRKPRRETDPNPLTAKMCAPPIFGWVLIRVCSICPGTRKRFVHGRSTISGGR